MTSEGDKASTQESMWKHIERVLSAIATILAIAGSLYPLGLIILWIQMWAAYSQSAHLAWHAAALVPRTTTVARAALLLFEHLVVASLVICYLILRFRLDGRVEKSFSPSRERRFRFGEWVKKSFSPFRERRFRVVLLMIMFMTATVVYLVLAFRSAPTRLSAVLAVLVVSGQVLAGVMAYVVAVFWLRDVSRLRRRLTVIAIVYGGVVITSILSASQSAPPLPFVDLNTGGQTQLKGKLLTHNAGFWYVLVEPSGDIKAIPDRAVDAVTITSAP